MEAVQQNKPLESELIRVPKSKEGIVSLTQRNPHPSIASAMELSLSYLTANNIRPSMTLSEYAKFTGMELRQVQSDAERNYLPLLKRTMNNRRELKRINMVALYAIPVIECFDTIEKRV